MALIKSLDGLIDILFIWLYTGMSEETDRYDKNAEAIKIYSFFPVNRNVVYKKLYNFIIPIQLTIRYCCDYLHKLIFCYIFYKNILCICFIDLKLNLFYSHIVNYVQLI